MSANKLTTPSRITKVIAVPRVRPALRWFMWDDASIPDSFSVVRDMTGGDERCAKRTRCAPAQYRGPPCDPETGQRAPLSIRAACRPRSIPQFEQKMGWQIGDIVEVGIERARCRARQAESRRDAAQRRPT